MRTLNDYFLTAEIEDISTASSTFVAVTGGGITVAHSGSAAGTVDTAEPTALNSVSEDGTIEMITDGASTGAQKLLVTFVVRR